VSGPALVGGRYRLDHLIGRGSTGDVWSAHDVLAGRAVALKRLRAEVAQDARLRRRLRREARAVARLEHPHIVRLYDMGVDDEGAPFLAMERVSGPTLADLGRDPAVGAPRLVALVEQVLGALAYAHARGVIHRDVKPHHIFVTSGADGEDVVKILDFGFARVENDEDQLTAARRDVFGTPTYMAPEQATGDYEVGPAADLYAVGVILWELLSGAPPFTGATATDIVVQHVTAPLPAFVPLPGRRVPPGMEVVLRQSLEKEPGRRFASAASMRRAVAAVFDGDEGEPTETVVNQPPPAVERPSTGDVSVITIADLAVVDAADGFALAPIPEEAPLVGRDALQRWLWERVVAVCNGGGARLVLLDGPAGIGKSRLCAWLGRTVAEGGWMTAIDARFRTGVAPRGLRGMIQQALGIGQRPAGAEALHHALSDLDPEERVDRDALAGYLWPGRGPRPPLGRVVRVVEDLARVIAGRRPLLVWLDDLEHADGEALLILDHLAAHLTARPAPVLVVATRRSDAAPAGSAAGTLARLLERHHGAIEAREVPRLTDESTASLARALLPIEGEAVRRVVEASRGNPLFVVEALQFAGDLRPDTPLPHTLVELVRRRLGAALEGGGDAAFRRGLAERLALLGGAFPFDLVEALERAAGVDPVRLETGLEGLVRLGVLVDEAGDAYAFVHEVVRQALLEELAGRADAPRLHERVAEAKLVWAGERLDRVAEEVARHLRAAGRVHDAVERLLLAARTAREAGQQAAAAALYLEADRWIGEAEAGPRTAALRADGMLGLAEVALDAGDHERALRMATRLQQWAREAGDPARLALALCLCGEASVAAGRWPEAGRVLEEARALLAARGERAAVARVDVARGRASLQAGALDEARRLFAEAATQFAAAGDLRGKAAAKRALGELAARAGERETARSLLSEAAAMAAGTSDHRLLAQASWRLGELLRQAGHLEEAAVRYRQAFEACEAAGDQAGAGRSLRGLGDTLRLLQRPETTRVYERAAEVFEALDDRFQLAICFTQLGRLVGETGDTAAAESWFERALAHFEQFDDPVRVGVLHAFLARLAQRRGDRAAREHRLQAALRIDATRPLIVADWPRILEELGEGIAADGDGRRAQRLFVRAVEVWTALRRADEAARCRARLAALVV
jgi:tetratricopeptide (TPR) repeat protein